MSKVISRYGNTYANKVETALAQERRLYDYFLATGDKLKDQNKELFLFLDSNLRAGKLDVVNNFVNNPAIKALHVSLVKSALIMTENLENINTDFLNTVYQEEING